MAGRVQHPQRAAAEVEDVALVVRAGRLDAVDVPGAARARAHRVRVLEQVEEACVELRVRGEGDLHGVGVALVGGQDLGRDGGREPVHAERVDEHLAELVRAAHMVEMVVALGHHHGLVGQRRDDGADRREAAAGVDQRRPLVAGDEPRRDVPGLGELPHAVGEWHDMEPVAHIVRIRGSAHACAMSTRKLTTTNAAPSSSVVPVMAGKSE